MKRLSIFAIALIASLTSSVALAFDQQHATWDQLLKKHVVWIDNGVASQVDYAGFQRDSAQLQSYLQSLSEVSQAEFDSWNKDQQLAFLINAYNAFTIDLILTEYPQVESIKDLGSFLQSPWKKRFFTLLGQERHLDELEHEMIRAKGVYDEPRIHVAVVCASIGCPALRDEAYVADRLDAQLEDSFKRFLSDRSRNRYNPQAGKLEVSKIFSWYKEDFDDGRFSSLNDMFARYADLLADAPATRQRIQQGNVPIDYLDYDWALNDVRG